VKEIKAEKIIHKNEKRIKLTYNFDSVIDNIVRQIEGRKWSRTLKSWHIPYSDTAYKNLSRLCKTHNIKILYGNKKKVPEQKKINKQINKDVFFEREIQTALSEFQAFMTVKRMSYNTIKAYTGAVKKFLEYHKDKKPNDITLEDFKDFNKNYIIKNKLSASYQNQLINALKTFYKKIFNKSFNIELLERPIKQKHLPNVFSQEEVKRLINSIQNIKHKSIISLIYSAGLRRSEVINLKITDIDSERKIIKISDSKGNKDRYVNLSDKILLMLRTYYKEYRPKIWIFESPDGKQYSASSIRNIFEKAKLKSGIKKKITLHGLRHSYATHLHEKGIDIRAIQELLGHNSIKTTEIYTHVSKKRINDIKSPFDDLDI